MDHGGKKTPHPLTSEDDEHPPAPGLPSYQEATSGPRQPPPVYFAPGTNTPGVDSTTTYPEEKSRAYVDDAASTSHFKALKFSISMQTSRLLQKKIFIKTTTADDTSATTKNATTTRWEVEYTTKYSATMKRLEVGSGTWGRVGAEPSSRDVATFKYPEFVLPTWCGVTITFLPHEAETPRHTSPTTRFMHCTGVMTTKYALDLPVMRNGRYVWQTTHQGGGGGPPRPGGREAAATAVLHNREGPGYWH
ncbi:hypothetical protein PG994_003064 [Apiospora phragmitis]|uniref:Uncharacterized protein n=1 Tax=Apiospora phragmitis TaxID=2905665 RepID=A0ABR1W779_9PEZI